MTAHLSSSINPLHFGALMHVCGTLVLCYQDSDLIVGVYNAFYEWVCLISHFVI